jgi:hypothetical protein
VGVGGVTLRVADPRACLPFVASVDAMGSVYVVVAARAHHREHRGVRQSRDQIGEQYGVPADLAFQGGLRLGSSVAGCSFSSASRGTAGC